nr:MAG TPA: hypothetical protein [Caudoviricetes sp.]
MKITHRTSLHFNDKVTNISYSSELYFKIDR